MRLYHNPRCSKSRQAVALLSESGIAFEEYRYLSEGIHPDDLELLSTLDGIIRSKDVLGEVNIKTLDVKGVQTLLNNQPKCLERPVLVANGQAVVGRPPERILEFLRTQ